MAQQDHATKQQHWVPQLYLKGWTFGEEQLWCFDKTTQKLFPSSTKNVAGSTWFNDVTETRDESNPALYQAVERLLAIVEGECTSIFESLRASGETLAAAFPEVPSGCGQLLSPIAVRNLSHFMALQHLRTDEARAMVRHSFTAMVKMGADAIIPVGFPGLDPTKYKVKPIENEIKKMHFQQFLRFAEFSPYFEDKYWLYGINTHKTPLVTSDNPIVKWLNFGGKEIPLDGVGAPGIRLVFPISPQLVLVMYDKKAYPEQKIWHRQLGYLSEKQVDFFNRLQLGQCRRQIYSRENDFNFAVNWCKKNPSRCVIDHNIVEPAGPIIDRWLSNLVAIAKADEQSKGGK